MTQSEYQKLYLLARKKMGVITLESRRELLKAYKQAASLVTSDTILSGLVDNSLQAGADLVSETLERITPEAISRMYGNLLEVDTEYIMDAVKVAGVGQITESGIRNIGFTVNQELLRSTVTRLYSDGYTFSDRIWGLYDSSGFPIGVNGDYQYRIKNLILTGQAQGRDAVKIAQDIQVYVSKGKDAVFNPGRYGKLVPGTGEYKARITRTVDWRALRIVRSELGASIKEAGLMEVELNPAATNMVDWIKTPGNPIDPDGSRNASGLRCIDLQHNNPYPKDSAPGMQHPNCSCFIRPILMNQNQFVNDLKEWVPGRGPAYLDQWYYGKYLQS